MKLRLMGKVYSLFYHDKPIPRGLNKRAVYAGFCEPPWRKKPRIVIRTNMKEKQELETLIHEMLHACDFAKTEWWIEEAGHDIATALWKLGWRKNEE